MSPMAEDGNGLRTMFLGPVFRILLEVFPVLDQAINHQKKRGQIDNGRFPAQKLNRQQYSKNDQTLRKKLIFFDIPVINKQNERAPYHRAQSGVHVRH